MPKFRVSGQVTISIHTDVEADTAEEAIGLAEDRGMINFCHQCATGDPSEEFVTGGELDGEPSELIAEELE